MARPGSAAPRTTDTPAKDRGVIAILAWTPISTLTLAPAHLPSPLMAPPTVVATSTPAQSGGISGALIGTLLSATILAALITAAVNIILARRKSREEERARPLRRHKLPTLSTASSPTLFGVAAPTIRRENEYASAKNYARSKRTSARTRPG
jgi:hypothetical protein